MDTETYYCVPRVQAAMNMGEESFPLGKCRVLCISPDDDMGFLINLPAPCNLLYQPLPDDGKVSHSVSGPDPLGPHYERPLGCGSRR